MNRSFPKPVPTPISAKSLSRCVGGYLTLKGFGESIIRSVSSPKDGVEGTLIFLKRNSLEKCQEFIGQTRASVIVTEKNLEIRARQCLIIVEDSTEWYIRALNKIFYEKRSRKVDQSAKVSDNVLMGHEIAIGAGSFIEEGCEIGDNCSVGINCYLGPGTKLGNNVYIQNNVTIGGVGLGYHLNKDNTRYLFPHLGSAILGDDVVIGSGTVIVRGEMDDTVIGERTRIGNLVNIGHNVQIKNDCAISSNTTIAGGTSIGARANIATGVTINAKLTIEDDCQIGLGSVVTKSIGSGKSVFGCPARPLPTMRRF